MKTKSRTITRILSLATVVAVLALQFMPFTQASAAQITTRSLTLQAGATDGGAMPGGVVNHMFNFTVPSVGSTNVGSIQFLYCKLAAGACDTPDGLVTTSATLGSENGATGFSINSTTNGAPFLYRTSALVSAGTALAYQLATITNPTITNKTFFVRISTYVSEDLTGGSTDAGTVAASTSTQIVLEGIMPESLVFCAGATVGLTVGVPDCATATPGAISFDKLFSPIDTSSTTSQMAASTNAGAGYSITVNGPTMTSGSNTITPMNAVDDSVKGRRQFGLNLKANTILSTLVPVGTEVAPIVNADNYRGQAATSYDTVDKFKFTSGDSVAKSDNGGPGGSDAQIFTVSYIVNVTGSLPAGTYTTTLTYICTPTF